MMSFEPVILWTDALIYVLMLVIVAFTIYVIRHEHLRAPWRQVFTRPLAMVAFVLLLSYVVVGFLDSIHYRPALAPSENGKQFYSTQVKSVLDVLMSPVGARIEKTYSAPFALHLYSKEQVTLANGKSVRTYPKLKYAGQNLASPADRTLNIVKLTLLGIAEGVALWLLLTALVIWVVAKTSRHRYRTTVKNICLGNTKVAWRSILLSVGFVLLFIYIAMTLSGEYHILGTDKIGQDVFYEAIKSIRTGLIIGTLTTLFMLPFAIMLGTSAGYFGGLIDDVIQYIYTTLSSVPGVLLITAAILALQVFIANHPDAFPTIAMRADARLLALCMILGVTSWVGLCRLLRAETLKLREMDFVQAAIAMGVRRFKIISRHVLPNVMHIILITVVLDFSGLVLAEAVLSYVGVGVDPSTISWGNMINSARLELAREPVVWWPILAAFTFMFTLVLSANFFADAVRDAFDPRIRLVEAAA